MSTIEELLATPQVEEVWEVDNRYAINSSYSDDQGPIEIVGKDIGDMSSQISIQGESISQYVEFIMPRYYDNIDLSEKNIVIHYTAGDRGGENAPINVYKSQERIKFGWAIPASATANEGTLSIGVWARGYVGTEEYMWKSRIAYYKVERGPVLGEGLSEPDVQWYLDFVREMDAKVTEASLYSTRAKQSENVAVESKESAIASSQAASGSAKTAVQKATEASSSASIASTHSAAAKVSAANAKESETKAQGYAEEARNNAEGFEPISDMMTGKSPTATNSINAPFVYGKFKGYIEQDGEPTPDNLIEINGLAKGGAIEVKTCGKNIFGGLALAQALVDSDSTNVVLDENAKTVTFGHNENYATKLILFKGNFKENTQYSFVLNGTHTNAGTSSDYYSTNLGWRYTDGTMSGMILNNTGSLSEVVKSDANKSVEGLIYAWAETGDTLTLNYEQCGLFEGVIALDEFTPYQGETTATIPTDAPLYEGDYLEVYADGSGKESHKMKSVDMGSLNWGYDNEKRFVASIADKTTKYATRTEPIYCDIYTSITDGRSFESVPNFSIYGSNTSGVYVHDNTYTDVTDFKNAVKGVMLFYELAEPIETPLTAQQVEQFKKLYSFEPVTNVLCDGEVEMIYFRNNPNGRVAGMLQRQIDSITSTLSSTEEV